MEQQLSATERRAAEAAAAAFVPVMERAGAMSSPAAFAPTTAPAPAQPPARTIGVPAPTPAAPSPGGIPLQLHQR
jgi:hypothetical protein